MGWHDSWIIVRDTDKKTLWDFFGLEEAPKSDRTEYGYVNLSGWSVVWAGSDGFHSRRELIDVSQLGFALRLLLNDTVTNLSTLTAAQDGKPLWEVTIGEDELLLLKGSPPLGLGALRELLIDFDSPMGEDYDIPPALAKSLSGFDADYFLDNVRYLQPKPGSVLTPPPPGWLVRLVGRPLGRAIKWWFEKTLVIGQYVHDRLGIFGHAIGTVLIIGLLIAPLCIAFFALLEAIRFIR